MKREFLDYVEDVIKSITMIEEFVSGLSYENFKKDEKTAYAVVRALEIIGESVKNMPVAIRQHYPEIQWKEMSAMRDKLIHAYFGVDLSVVWKTIKEELPPLKPLFEKIKRDCQK
ncbi:MAG: DUF86 domain-containing protein [Candidatus Aenigmarchaeota archaeon]|nr:DUF86 domain-containing protein [Candidatus Aenigmarchaeota archaeon]